jgi:16S rRNA (cytosine967-C5)-methyltransferase
LLEQFAADWPDHWTAIAEAGNRPAPLWLRHNAASGDIDDARQALERDGFEVRGHPLAPDALVVDPAAPVSTLPGFPEGRLSVQDPAAQLAAPLLQARPGDRVLDACSAPGGKTCHLLERTPGVRVTALDRSPTRLERVQENLERLNLKARLLAADAAEPSEWWDGRPFDRILLDAPCSATGVIRRHPEIKWLRTPAQVDDAVALQARLLDALWPLLKPGGILVYATCSVLRRENNQQIQAFLADHPDAACTGPDGFGHPGPPGRQVLPGEQEMDGFYYAVLHRSPA